jgi:hypothetical protein
MKITFYYFNAAADCGSKRNRTCFTNRYVKDKTVSNITFKPDAKKSSFTHQLKAMKKVK